MIDAIRNVLRDAARYARLCPLLFLLPAGIEAVQHVVEWRAGFYEGLAAMKAAEHDVARMVVGHLKVAALFLTGFAATRCLLGGTARWAVKAEARTYLLYVPVVAWGLFWLVAIQDGPMLAAALGAPAQTEALAILAAIVVTMFFEPCLSAWKVAAAGGDARFGFDRSIRLIQGSYGWAIGLSMLVTLPLMILHYALAFAVLGRSPMTTAIVLAADSLLVSAMGAIMAAMTVAIAQRMTAHHGLAIEFRRPPAPAGEAGRAPDGSAIGWRSSR